MTPRLAIVVVVLGAGAILAAKLFPVWERSKIETLKGEKTELDKSRDEKKEALAEEVKKLREAGDAAAAEKRDEKGSREIEEAKKADAKRVEEIDKEVIDRETRLQTKAMRTLHIKLGGAAAVLLALLVLAFAGSDVERAVAIFAATILLPALF
ncbi:MAG: hypothetical protein HY720_24350 [Planctomycetes bacterium]|nr:hypothetical protein [Planctomycetota bacterium]